MFWEKETNNEKLPQSHVLLFLGNRVVSYTGRLPTAERHSSGARGRCTDNQRGSPAGRGGPRQEGASR